MAKGILHGIKATTPSHPQPPVLYWTQPEMMWGDKISHGLASFSLLLYH